MRHNEMMYSGSKKNAVRLLAVVGMLLAAASAEAQQFSADLIAQNGETMTPVGSLRVSEGKARIETAELSDGFFLVDAAKPLAYFIRPRARVFMDAKQSSQLTQMFVPVDPDDPCRQWQAMASLAAPIDPKTWRCERDGEGTATGRKMDVYRITGAAGFGFVGWVDRERKFPLQIKTVDGTVIIAVHIRDEPQPTQSFEIPSGVRKFDPEALIRRIQQSDVWVAPPASE